MRSAAPEAPPVPADPVETVDVFHRGAFSLVQPKERGHRAGTDALLLAAAVPSGFAGRLADLGAGAGAAGLAVAARCPEARVVLVERAPEMAGYARRSLALAENARLAPRLAVVEADVTLSGRARQGAGLGDAAFDFAIMNPPFNDARHRPASDALRREAHMMDDALLDGWARTAAAILRPRGGFAAILRPQSLAAALAALSGRFGAVEVKPIHPRADAPAIRIVLRAVRASRAPLRLMPPLVLHHDAGGGFTQEAAALADGRVSLFGD